MFVPFCWVPHTAQVEMRYVFDSPRIVRHEKTSLRVPLEAVVITFSETRREEVHTHFPYNVSSDEKIYYVFQRRPLCSVNYVWRISPRLIVLTVYWLVPFISVSTI